MQYKREEVRDMNLYGEILKKLEGTPCLALERSFVGEEGNLADMRCELREGAEASEIGKEALTQGQPVCGRAGSSWNVAEPFFPKERLIILGGGHVALPVVDDRLSFANPGRFPMAEKVICDDFGHAIKELKIQESDYICIVTRGHRHDADCLRMIGKGKEPAYLGMIGSRRRVGIVKQELLEEGYDPERMSRLKSPIGLKIGGVTPEEIAISILAEIIQVKRRAAFQRPQTALGKAVLVFPVFLALVPIRKSSVGILSGCRFQRIVLGKFTDDEAVSFSDEPRESQVAADDAFQECFIGVFRVCNKVKAR